MGLFSSKSEFHTHDNSVRVTFPDKMVVEEHKSPTEESIRLMEEMHDKALKNIIAKVKVENNIVLGVAYLINQPFNLNDCKVVYKFKINGQEFTIDKEVNKSEFITKPEPSLRDMELALQDSARAMILWYTLKKFTQVVYEEITQSKLPDYFIK